MRTLLTLSLLLHNTLAKPLDSFIYNNSKLGFGRPTEPWNQRQDGWGLNINTFTQDGENREKTFLFMPVRGTLEQHLKLQTLRGLSINNNIDVLRQQLLREISRKMLGRQARSEQTSDVKS